MIKIMHLDSCTANSIGQNLDHASDADRRFYDLSREVTRSFLDADQLSAIVRELVGLGGYIAVADVDTDDLDVAYRQTNHIMSDWTLNRDVEALVKRPRSSSVGDVFIQPYNQALRQLGANIEGKLGPFRSLPKITIDLVRHAFPTVLLVPGILPVDEPLFFPITLKIFNQQVWFQALLW